MLAVVRGGERGTILADRISPAFCPAFSLFSDHLRTVLAVEGSLRRAFDGSRPF
jgi:hypothetical protein